MGVRPSPAEIKKRALDIVEESMAYPETARGRLVELKRSAIQDLIAKPGENAATLEKYYPGWTADDLKTLLSLLPAGKKDQWHL